MAGEIEATLVVKAPNGEISGDSGRLAVSNEGLEWRGRRSFPVPWTDFWQWGMQEQGIFRPRIVIWVIVRDNTLFRFDCGRKGDGGERFFERIEVACPMSPS